MVWPQAIEHGINRSIRHRFSPPTKTGRAVQQRGSIPAPDRTANKGDGPWKLKQKLDAFSAAASLIIRRGCFHVVVRKNDQLVLFQ